MRLYGAGTFRTGDTAPLCSYIYQCIYFITEVFLHDFTYNSSVVLVDMVDGEVVYLYVKGRDLDLVSSLKKENTI